MHCAALPANAGPKQRRDPGPLYTSAVRNYMKNIQVIRAKIGHRMPTDHTI